MKIKEQLIIYGTIALISMPAVFSAVWPDSDVTINENRIASGFPSTPASLETLAKWPSQVDEFLEDHFFVRSNAIRYSSKLLLTPCGLSINQNVIIGKNDWLYISKSFHAIEKFQGLYTFKNEKQKDKWIQELNELAMWSRQMGSDFVFVIIPSKHTVYPEYLPEKYTPHGQSHTESIVKILREKAAFKWIDLRPILIDAAKKEIVFYKHDTHWNERGSYLAYLEIMNTIKKEYSVNILNPSQFLFQTREKVGGDLARLLGLKDEYHEMAPLLRIKYSNVTSRDNKNYRESITTVETSQKTLAKALVLCDSFVNSSMAKYLNESFSSISYKHHKNLNFDRNIIRQVNPDITFVMITERLLPLEIKEQELNLIQGSIDNITISKYEQDN